MNRKPLLTVLCLACLATPAFAATEAPERWLGFPFPAPLDVTLNAEIGFLGVLAHEIQFGSNGTRFDYVREGGQQNLYLFARLSADVTMLKHHTFTALYQPLDVQTQQILRRDIVVDDQLFPAGTPMNFRYGFPFWRLSYMYDFRSAPDEELAVGGGIQLRNATIAFQSTDGSLLRTNENIGPVPLAKFRYRHTFHNKMFVGAEVDAVYAAGRGITGSANNFIGSLIDASIRGGMALGPAVDAYINLRFLAGGAKGKEEGGPGPGDGFTRNWLYTMTVSIGIQLKATQAER